METATTSSPDIDYQGTKAQRELAQEIHAIMLARGRFMALYIPIRVPLDEVIDHLKESRSRLSTDLIDKAVDANSDILSFEDIDDVRYIVATRSGRPPAELRPDTSHSFVDRMMSPLPKPEMSSTGLRPRSRSESIWSSIEPEPDYLLPTDTSLIGGAETTIAAGESKAEIGARDEAYSESAAERRKPASEVSNVADESIDAPEQAATEDVTMHIVPSAEPTDLSSVSDSDLAGAVLRQLASDSRVAEFAGQWMLEERVPRLSRGDVRRLRDYVEEQEQPLTDEVLVQDVLEVRPKSPDFELIRFGLNYRLQNEHRDFDFTGTNDQRFWSVSQLPAIGTIRRKANEIGTDYRFMLEELPEQPPYRSAEQVSHVLSFYEFYLGLLPYDPEMQSLLPAPLVEGQRVAVLTFEFPQSYATYLVELRYPTPNRGGYLVGLDEFYQEHLVPGALISITASAENDGHFVVEFDEADAQSRRLLELEDRRNRYVFRATSFQCSVLEEYLIDEDRFPGFAGEKPMSDKMRRKPESVVSKSFERRGNELEGGGYSATFAELMAASSVERPITETLLRSVLDKDDSGAFAPDPDTENAFTYIPGKSR